MTSSDPTPAHPFPRQQNHEPVTHPAAALFDADPRLADGVDATAASVAIECAATQLSASVTGGPSVDEDATPRVVRVRDAAIALARATLLAARAMPPVERPAALAPTAASSPEERFRRALDAEAFAERAYRSAREATDTARAALLSARAREVTDEEQRIRELCIQRARQVGLDAAEGVSR